MYCKFLQQPYDLTLVEVLVLAVHVAELAVAATRFFFQATVHIYVA
jgi:hypothetical protein